MGKALWRDLQSTGARVEELSGQVAALEREKNAIQARLNALQQEKGVLDSAGKDLRERIRPATERRGRDQQLARAEAEAQTLERAIRAACTEAGLQTAPATPAAERLKALAGAYVHFRRQPGVPVPRAGDGGDQRPAREHPGGIDPQSDRRADRKNTLSRQLQVLATKDKDLARKCSSCSTTRT